MVCGGRLARHSFLKSDCFELQEKDGGGAEGVALQQSRREAQKEGQRYKATMDSQAESRMEI